MKKNLIILLIAFTTSIFAQKKLNFYATGNYGLYKVNISDIYGSAISSNFGGGLGAHIVYKLLPNLNLVALPVIQQRGYMSSNIYHNYDIRVTYIDVPVGVEYTCTPKKFGEFFNIDDKDEKLLFIGMQLYEGFAIDGKFTDSFSANPSSSETIKFGESATDQRLSTDFGLNFTVGLNIKRFRIGFQKLLGLKNVVPTDRQTNEGSIKTTGFGMFVAYKLY